MNNENTYSSSFIAKRFYINEARMEEVANYISYNHIKPMQEYRDNGFPDIVEKGEAFIDEKFLHCAEQASLNLYHCIYLYRAEFAENDPKACMVMSHEQLYETLVGLLLVEREYNDLIVEAVKYAFTHQTIDINELKIWREKIRQLIIELKVPFHKPVFEYRMYPTNRDLFQITCQLKPDADSDAWNNGATEDRYPPTFTQLLTRPCWEDTNTKIIQEMLNESRVFPNHTVVQVKRLCEQMVVHTPIDACDALGCNVHDEIELYDQIEICMFPNRYPAAADDGWQKKMKPYIPAPALLPELEEDQLTADLLVSIEQQQAEDKS